MSDKRYSSTAEDRGALAVYKQQHGRPPTDTANGAWLYGESRDKARVVLKAAHDPVLGPAMSVNLGEVLQAVREMAGRGYTVQQVDAIAHGLISQFTQR